MAALHLATLSSLYAPHPFPRAGPFFEGWYTRVVEQGGQSFGVIIGHVLKAGRDAEAAINTSSNALPLTYVSLMRSVGSGDEPMEAHNCYPDAPVVTVDGKTVTTKPDIQSPPRFRWESSAGAFDVTPNSTLIDFVCGDIHFTAEIADPVPWSRDGLGPAGMEGLLPLPLQWFVYSLRSRVVRYRWLDARTGAVSMEGRDARAHQEKNWGRAFPGAWNWAQALDVTSGIGFALSAAPIVAGVDATLLGYRHPALNLSVDFAPGYGRVALTSDGCRGTLRLTAFHRARRLELDANLSSIPLSLTRCLLGPTAHGFAPTCVESYVATATVAVSLAGRELARTTIRSVALEFGAGNICRARDPCRQPSTGARAWS